MAGFKKIPTIPGTPKTKMYVDYIREADSDTQSAYKEHCEPMNMYKYFLTHKNSFGPEWKWHRI